MSWLNFALKVEPDAFVDFLLLSNLNDTELNSSPGKRLPQLQRLVIAPSQRHSQQVSLTGEQRHYLQRVLRLGPGDRFIVLDGQGHTWIAALGQATPSGQLEAEILEAVTAQTEISTAVTLVAALPKGSGFDEVVRQATEIGVSCIAPVVSDRTLLNPSPQKLDRWRRIVQEAAEQSERQVVPAILEPVKFTASLKQMTDAAAESYLCVARGDSPHLLTCLLSKERTSIEPFISASTQRSIRIAIGPEGGWTEAEIEQAIAVGYQPVSLGPRILRAVTAPLVALSLTAAALEGLRS